MDAHDKSTTANIVGWLALVIGIIALILAWVAYDRASVENLGETIESQVEETIPNDIDVQSEDNTTEPNSEVNDNATMDQDDMNTVPGSN